MLRLSRAAGAHALAVLLLGASACAPDIPTETRDLPPVEGLWEYSASEIRFEGGDGGAQCLIRGLELEIGPWRAAGFNGRTRGGEMECTGSLTGLGGPLAEFPIRRGGAVAQYVAFDIGGPRWRNDGEIRGDTIVGIFNLQHEAVRLTGRFRAVRLPAARASVAPQETDPQR